MATRKTPQKKPATGSAQPVAIADLPDAKTAQVNEALTEAVPFLLRDGTTLEFKPPADWSFRATQAYVMGDFAAWARGALADPADFDRFMDLGQRDIGRMVRYFDDQSGVTRGEADSSSQS